MEEAISDYLGVRMGMVIDRPLKFRFKAPILLSSCDVTIDIADGGEDNVDEFYRKYVTAETSAAEMVSPLSTRAIDKIVEAMPGFFGFQLENVDPKFPMSFDFGFSIALGYGVAHVRMRLGGNA
jgi:hypothetical protein